MEHPMSMGHARIEVVGNLGADPFFSAGSGDKTSFCAVRVAVNRKKADGTTSTAWYECVVFGKTAEACAKILRKGDTVFADGEPVLETYKKQDGSFGATIKLVGGRLIFCGRPAPKTETANAEAPADAAAEAMAALREAADGNMPF
jgi:single-stranded DNA-binding protein